MIPAPVLIGLAWFCIVITVIAYIVAIGALALIFIFAICQAVDKDRYGRHHNAEPR